LNPRPLGYEAPAGCPVGCSLVVLVPFDLGERLPVVSVCTGLSRLFAAGLGDKCSDKLRFRRQLARGVRPVLGDNGPCGQAAGGGTAASERILIRHIRGMRSCW
jgi:hypothetical protein